MFIRLKKWQTCISFMGVQMVTVRMSRTQGGHFKHLLQYFRFESREEAAKVGCRCRYFGVEKDGCYSERRLFWTHVHLNFFIV
jgi:hypothetical protein